jgi:hypothetical protein
MSSCSTRLPGPEGPRELPDAALNEEKLMFRTRQARHAMRGNLRISDEHDLADSRDQGGIEATDDRGRRCFQLRPKPRRRIDLWGFNSTWWMALGWAILIVLAVVPIPWW